MIWFISFAIMALAVCPIAYIRLCERMKKARVEQPPFVAFFFLFGTIGGWFLAFALSPSGLAAMCLLFLGTITPLALLGSSLHLAGCPERSVYHQWAKWSGFAYAGLFAVLIVVGRSSQAQSGEDMGAAVATLFFNHGCPKSAWLGSSRR